VRSVIFSLVKWKGGYATSLPSEFRLKLLFELTELDVFIGEVILFLSLCPLNYLSFYFFLKFIYLFLLTSTTFLSFPAPPLFFFFFFFSVCVSTEKCEVCKKIFNIYFLFPFYPVFEYKKGKKIRIN
jgi:hypothetical protein